jgi:hypothetical protein
LTGSNARSTRYVCMSKQNGTVWEGCWKHELCREGVQVGPPSGTRSIEDCVSVSMTTT